MLIASPMSSCRGTEWKLGNFNLQVISKYPSPRKIATTFSKFKKNKVINEKSDQIRNTK